MHTLAAKPAPIGNASAASRPRQIQSNEIEDHVRWLLSVAAPAPNLVRTRPKASAFIELALVGNSGTVLPSDLIQFAHELNAEIGFVTRRGRAG